MVCHNVMLVQRAWARTVFFEKALRCISYQQYAESMLIDYIFGDFMFW